MNHIKPLPASYDVSRTGIINSIYETNQFKQSINKKDISYPYNPKGTVLSNRGSNALGYPTMDFVPTNSERPSLDRINSKHSSNSKTGSIIIGLDDSMPNSNNKNMQNVNSSHISSKSDL
jgi:hypothetical protein